MGWVMTITNESLIAIQVNIIYPIQQMFKIEDWDIKDVDALAVWMSSHESVFGDEWIYAARDLISNLNLKMTAREFFFRGHKQSSIFDTSDSKPRSAMESILMIYPDFFESELVRDVVDRAVAMDADYVNSDIYKAVYHNKRKSA